MKLSTISDAEQKEEAVRAIVTAQHETEAVLDERLSGIVAILRRDIACEWLSLVA